MLYVSAVANYSRNSAGGDPEQTTESSDLVVPLLRLIIR